MNMFSTGQSKTDKLIDMGLGGGGGAVVSIPITSIIAFVPEMNFLYRTLFVYSETEDSYSYEMSNKECAISFPLMFQVMPIAGTPIYFAGGLQLDIPFATKKYTEEGDGISKESKEEAIGDRAMPDFGIALGTGYHISQNLGIDVKFVIGLTSISTRKDDDSSLKQLGIGVSYLF